VLLTTQYLDEADQLAQRVAIIDHGRVIAEGTPAELKDRAGRDVIEVHAHDRDDLHRLAEALTPLGVDEARVEPSTGRVTVPVDGGRAVIAQAVRELDDLRIEVDDIGLRRPTLDEVFLTLTGAPIGDGPDGPDGGDDPDDGGVDHRDRQDHQDDRDGELARPGAA
jgi:ABC-2 type transport system ATP-binding protein